MQVIPLSDMLEILKFGRSDTVRPVDRESSEEPDFVQKRNKLCTGMCGRLSNGVAYSFGLVPPVQLVAGRGYKIVLEGN